MNNKKRSPKNFLTASLENIDNVTYRSIKVEEENQKNEINLLSKENYIYKTVLECYNSLYINAKLFNYDDVDILNFCKDTALQLFSLNKKEWYVDLVNYSESIVYSYLSETIIDHPDSSILFCFDESINFNQKHKITLARDSNDLFLLNKLKKKLSGIKMELVILNTRLHPRDIDYKKFRTELEIVKSVFAVDISHMSGYVICKMVNCPFSYSDVVICNTDGLLRGLKANLIFYRSKKFLETKCRKLRKLFKLEKLCDEYLQISLVSCIALSLKQALSEEYQEYIFKVNENAKALTSILKGLGYAIVTDNTEMPYILIDIGKKNLMAVNVKKTCSILNLKVDVFYFGKGKVTQGIVIGLQAITALEFKVFDMDKIAYFFNEAVKLTALVKNKNINETFNLDSFARQVRVEDKAIEIKNEITSFLKDKNSRFLVNFN